MNTQIIAFAGKKQSGKNTACNFLIALKLTEFGICQRTRVNENGDIEVTDVFEEKMNGQEWFLFKEPFVDVQGILGKYPIIKLYSFANKLKLFCEEYLGVPYELSTGTDADKATLTNLRWENMPGVITDGEFWDSNSPDGDLSEYQPLHFHEPGFMTVREVLQFFGTEIFRKIDNDFWIKILMKEIEEDGYQIALISDARFNNEIEIIKSHGGIVLGLTRDKFKSEDQHASEQINFDLCSAVIDNSNMTIIEQNEAIYKALSELGCKYLTETLE